MPLMMAIAEWRYLKTGDEVYNTLARRWAVGTAIMFAVGAVPRRVAGARRMQSGLTEMFASQPILN